MNIKKLTFHLILWLIICLGLSLSFMALPVLADEPFSWNTSTTFNSTKGQITADILPPQQLKQITILTDTVLWGVSFWAVPSSEGTELFVSTSPTTQLDTTVTANVTIGGARSEFDMTYNITDTAYQVQTYPIITQGLSNAEGTLMLNSTTTNSQTLSTGTVSFRQFLVPTQIETTIVSSDNNTEVFFSADTLNSEAYVLLMPAHGMPSPLPAAHQFVSSPYAVRASGSTLNTPNPMLLKLAFSEVSLGDIDPHTLSIFRWNGSNGWDELEGDLDNQFDKALNLAINQFGVYTLFATPRWLDSFGDFTGLSVRDNITIYVAQSSLILNNSFTGHAISNLITPTLSTYAWDSVIFNADTPLGTTLTVDVLTNNDTTLYADVNSGFDLSTLDPNLHPSLKLQATFITTDTSITPQLLDWRIAWQPIYKVYLPLLLK